MQIGRFSLEDLETIMSKSYGSLFKEACEAIKTAVPKVIRIDGVTYEHQPHFFSVNCRKFCYINGMQKPLLLSLEEAVKLDKIHKRHTSKDKEV